MNTPLSILHLEDSDLDAQLIHRVLSAEGLVREIVRVDNGEEYVAALDRRRYDFIISDFTVPAFNGMAALKAAREKQPEAPFIFVSGTIEEELAVESLKRGATDYVFKNRLSRLVPAVRRALHNIEERDENRRAEEAMRQSEHKYRQLFESLGDAAFLADLQTGRIVDTNLQGERLLGCTRGEIIGTNLSRLQLPSKFEEYRRKFITDNPQSAAVDFESEVMRRDGRVTPVSIRATVIQLYGRKLILGLYRDMTERKRAAEQIQEQAKLLDLVPDAIIVRGLDDRIQYWNEGAARLYGWTKNEVLGRKATELLYHDQAEFDVAQKTVLESGEWSGELHHSTREGQEVLVHSRWTLMRSPQNQPKSILIVNIAVEPAGCLEREFDLNERSKPA